MNNGKIAAVILAAGSSSRMGGKKKEFLKMKRYEFDPVIPVIDEKFSLNNLTVLGSSVNAFSSVPSVEIIVIVVPENNEAAARDALPPEFLTTVKPEIHFISGGSTRRASVYNALSFLAQISQHSPSVNYVLIHDGARPWISSSLIENIITAVIKHDAVIPLLPLTDTPKETVSSEQLAVSSEQLTENREQGTINREQLTENREQGTINREQLTENREQGTINREQLTVNSEIDKVFFIKKHLKRRNVGLAQTPQAFRFPEIFHAHEKAVLAANEEFTDDAEIWGRFCGLVAVIPGDPANKKITFKEDLY